MTEVWRAAPVGSTNPTTQWTESNSDRPANQPPTRAGTCRRTEPGPPSRNGSAMGPARLRAVEPGPRLRLPRWRGLDARGLAARSRRQGRADREPADRGQPALLPPRDLHALRARRSVGH